MRNLKTYKLFIEAVEVNPSDTKPPSDKPYENIMKDMADNDEIEVNKVEDVQKNIDDIKVKIEGKKKELETKLQNLENLEVETFTEANQKILEDKKLLIGKAIEDLKKEIEGYETTIQTFRDNIDRLKK